MVEGGRGVMGRGGQVGSRHLVYVKLRGKFWNCEIIYKLPVEKKRLINWGVWVEYTVE